LLALSPAGVALWRLDDGRFLDVNAAMLQLTGHTREQFLALDQAHLTAAEFLAEHMLQRKELLDHGRCGPGETELLHRQGHRVPVLASARRVRGPGGQDCAWTLVQDLSPQLQMEQRLLDAARADRLTGLPNRLLLMERLAHVVHSARAFALLFMDFDRFKLVNDSLGHDAGDELLCQVAQRLRGTLRAGDVLGPQPDGNLVARFGGDEFVVLLHDCARPEEARRVAQRLLDAFSAPFVVKGKQIHSSVSIGVVMGGAAGGAAGADADALLRNADTALNEAKRDGRGRAVFFDPCMQARLARALTLEDALRQAEARGQLSLAYQPIVDLASGQIVSAEALLRWQHPELGAVSPAEFIPVAEESGLIVPIGEWVLREAARQWAAWQPALPGARPISISVNLSRAQMRQPERLLDAVRQVIADQCMPPGALQLEVTEREVMHEPTEMRALMQRLHELGVRLAMDDFGTGTSSLGCLRDYPFDVVKIDKSFLAGLPTHPDVMAVLHATVTVIENLGMLSVAEGVEEPAQVALLQAIGCHHAQGYLFARPLPGSALPALLARPLVAHAA
jgi:diguanylate cyclase (GGDEF)-like protein/PAS domain S-box-containing protein